MGPVTLAFLDLGFQEIVIVMIFGLLLYGGRLPEVARSLGRTVAEFKRNAQGLTREFHVDLDDPPRPPPRPRKVPDAIPRDTREDDPPEERESVDPDEVVDEAGDPIPRELATEDVATPEPPGMPPREDEDAPPTPFSADPPLPPESSSEPGPPPQERDDQNRESA